MGAMSGPPYPMSETSDVDARTRAAHAARVTLTELLVSTTVLALLVGATLLTLEQGHQAWTVGAARVEAQQSARAALTGLAGEVRAAGQGMAAPGRGPPQPPRRPCALGGHGGPRRHPHDRDPAQEPLTRGFPGSPRRPRQLHHPGWDLGRAGPTGRRDPGKQFSLKKSRVFPLTGLFGNCNLAN